MLMPEPLQLILDTVDGDIKAAAEKIYSGPKQTALYVITVGLENMKARHRAQRRRELREDIRPEFKRGKTEGSVILTERAKKRVFEHTKTLFGRDGWDIGELNLGDFTKETLLVQAYSERKSASGHIRNAQFYEALAEPMQAGQLVRAHWTPEAATKLKDRIFKEAEGKKPVLVP